MKLLQKPVQYDKFYCNHQMKITIKMGDISEEMDITGKKSFISYANSTSDRSKLSLVVTIFLFLIRENECRELKFTINYVDNY